MGRFTDSDLFKFYIFILRATLLQRVEEVIVRAGLLRIPGMRDVLIAFLVVPAATVIDFCLAIREAGRVNMGGMAYVRFVQDEAHRLEVEYNQWFEELYGMEGDVLTAFYSLKGE